MSHESVEVRTVVIAHGLAAYNRYRREIKPTWIGKGIIVAESVGRVSIDVNKAARRVRSITDPEMIVSNSPERSIEACD